MTNHDDETQDIPQSEVIAIARDRKRQEVHDLRIACKLLFEFGATDDEVDDILTDRPVPINPDEEWAYAELSRYRSTRREEW